MFAKCDFKILELKDGNKFLGIVKTNDDILIKKYNHPFIRNSPKSDTPLAPTLGAPRDGSWRVPW